MSSLWIVLIAYGAIAFAFSPKARDARAFFEGRGPVGGDVGTGLLIGSVVASWLFAKSITNAANLGGALGWVGVVAYAGWYLSIPIAGVVIYRIRTTTQHASLVGFLRHKHGRAATVAFTGVIVLRLFNEVWSNTAVVGSYFGSAGSPSYLAAAAVFTVFTGAYTLRGGMRSSLLTDAVQFALLLFLLGIVLFTVVPGTGFAPLVTSGSWTLVGGVDLLLVAVIQSFSYPFHDPVLTDRAFITSPRRMLVGYVVAGAVAGAFILLFGLVGVYANQAGLPSGQDTALRVAAAFGTASMLVMSSLMMVSAGSTIDSTLTSTSRLVAVDFSATNTPDAPRIRRGRIAMVGVLVVGSIPLVLGTEILAATTVSGTMVLGLAPVFLFHRTRRAAAWSFHLPFFTGLIVGVAVAVGQLPAAWHIGDGRYAGLLGTNVYGTAAVFIAFLVGITADTLARRAPRRSAIALPD